MTKKVIVLGMAASMVLMSGCATIMSGKTQTIDVTSATTKKFSIDGQNYTTPAKVLVKRSQDDKEISVNGCDKKVPLKASMNPAVMGNILLGGVFGSTTDLAGGAGWKYDDNVTLDCQ